jgi:hypothetical protein
MQCQLPALVSDLVEQAEEGSSGTLVNDGVGVGAAQRDDECQPVALSTARLFERVQRLPSALGDEDEVGTTPRARCRPGQFATPTAATGSIEYGSRRPDREA